MQKSILILVAFILAACIALSSLSGCDRKEKEKKESLQSGITSSQTKGNDEEIVKIKYFSMHAYATFPERNNVMLQWLKDHKGIQIEYSGISERQEDRMNMMLSSGEIPDVVSIEVSENAVAIVNKWAEAGYITEMDEWIEKYPNLVKYCDKEYNKYYYGNRRDGKMYLIPIAPASVSNISNVGPVIRRDWLKRVGKEAPKTIDELYDVLKAFKDHISDVDGKKIIPASFNRFRQYIGYAWTCNWFNISEDGENLNFYFNNPEIEGYMLYMNQLYREGLLDVEMITQKEEQFVAKLGSGRVGFTCVPTWTMDEVNASLKAVDAGAGFIPCPPIRVPGKPLPVYDAKTPHMNAALVVSRKFGEDRAKLEKLMEFLSWNASNEGSTILNLGPEGMFSVKNADGLYVDKPETKAKKMGLKNMFLQKTGLSYYNLMMFPIIPRNTVDEASEEVKMTYEVWKEGTAEVNYKFHMVGVGEEWYTKWGKMWDELPKWESKAIFAHTLQDSRKVVEDMLKAYESNGGREIVEEKKAMYKEFIKMTGNGYGKQK